MKTKLEIIDETVDFYSEDVNRRAVRDGGNCEYLTDDGKMCAVGRCFTKEGLLRYKDELGGFNKYMMHHLKEEYRIEDDQFWSDLQYLHDMNRHWDENGLNENGKEYLCRIKRDHCET